MGRIYSDSERLMQADSLMRDGRRGKAAAIYRKMGNEYRDPAQKRQLHDMADRATKPRRW